MANPVGSVADFVSRLRNRFPVGWAGSVLRAPVFSAVIFGMATVHANFYQLATFAGQMVYLQSSQGGWLDTWAYDFFGINLLRDPGESDGSFYNRVRVSLFRQTCTREAVTSIVTDLTGVVPTLIEPWRGLDTFALNETAFALNGPGRLGALDKPFQALILVPGVASSSGGLALNFSPLNADNYLGTDSSEAVSRDNILNAINLVRPAGVTVFVQFT